MMSNPQQCLKTHKDPKIIHPHHKFSFYVRKFLIICLYTFVNINDFDSVVSQRTTMLDV